VKGFQFSFEDHLGVMDFYFKRTERGLHIEHSYHFRSTRREFGDKSVARIFDKWKIDGEEAGPREFKGGMKYQFSSCTEM